MSVERQKEEADHKTASDHGASGEGGTRAAAFEASQALTALDQKRALTKQLMEKVCDRANLNRAYRRVKVNKGAPGVDGMTVDDLYPWLIENKERLLKKLLEGSYRPQAVRGVEIPKPGGGTRQLGIPTVVDRLIQQAILQVLEPIFDPTFSSSSYGFRPGRSAHQALAQGQNYVKGGRVIVVDVDIEKFFDRVNHDILMSRLARRIEDKRLLRIVRRFLQAGIMKNGVCVEREEGTPQGGPLSPLLSNLLLDELDKELEKRGHAFCRYADDCNIYVRTKVAGERVMESVAKFLEKRLRLRVNREKSKVAFVEERKFLGYRLLTGGRLGIAPSSLKRVRQRIRELTRRNRGQSLERIIAEINPFLRGWVAYFHKAACRNHLQRMDEWLKRRLRCFRLKQRKRAKPIADFLQKLGVPEWRAWLLAGSGSGWWRKAGCPQATEAMNNDWFSQLGLMSLSAQYAKLNL